jgi:hypothetical protein
MKCASFTSIHVFEFLCTHPSQCLFLGQRGRGQIFQGSSCTTRGLYLYHVTTNWHYVITINCPIALSTLLRSSSLPNNAIPFVRLPAQAIKSASLQSVGAYICMYVHIANSILFYSYLQPSVTIHIHNHSITILWWLYEHLMNIL